MGFWDLEDAKFDILAPNVEVIFFIKLNTFKILHPLLIFHRLVRITINPMEITFCKSGHNAKFYKMHHNCLFQIPMPNLSNICDTFTLLCFHGAFLSSFFRGFVRLRSLCPPGPNLQRIYLLKLIFFTENYFSPFFL